MAYIYKEERISIPPLEIVNPVVSDQKRKEYLIAEKLASDMKELLISLTEKNSPILLMLSGGSSLLLLDFLNIESLRYKIIGPNVTICALDERYEFKKENNNWSQISEKNFFSTVKNQGANFITSTPDEKKDLNDKLVKESFTDFAQRIENSIDNWMNKNRNGIIIATLGIGKNDKHIAGLIPEYEREEIFYKNLIQSNKYITQHEIDKDINPFPKRVTPTYKFLTEKIDYAFVYAVNKEKEIKETIWTENQHKEKYHLAPSLILWKMKNVKIYTDTPIPQITKNLDNI